MLSCCDCPFPTEFLEFPTPNGQTKATMSALDLARQERAMLMENTSQAASPQDRQSCWLKVLQAKVEVVRLEAREAGNTNESLQQVAQAELDVAEHKAEMAGNNDPVSLLNVAMAKLKLVKLGDDPLAIDTAGPVAAKHDQGSNSHHAPWQWVIQGFEM